VLRDLIFFMKLKLGFLKYLNHCLGQLHRISMRLYPDPSQHQPIWIYDGGHL